MFYKAHAFDQPIGEWDVSSVKEMSFMFCKAKKFNQPLGSWNVSSVKNMRHMFDEAISFYQPLNDWNVDPESVNTENMFLRTNYKNRCDMYLSR